jgi:Flp pilus assembly protein TadG
MPRIKGAAKWYYQIRNLSGDQSGVAIVLVALLITTIMGFTAFSIDIGRLLQTRRQMVTAADAAALAGAKEMAKTGDSSKGDQTGRAYALNNGAEEPLVTIAVKEIVYDGSPRQVVEATAGRNLEYTFARVLGFTNQDVKYTSTATWGYLKKVGGGNVLPLFCTSDLYDSGPDVNLHYGKIMIDKEWPNGNWGFFNIGIGDAWKETLKGNPANLTLSIDQPENSDPGNKQALIGCIETRMDRTARGETSMTGLVPIIDVEGIYSDPPGSSQLVLPIKYFAVYKIEDVVTDNKGNGSTHADCDLTVETPAKTYTGLKKGTIIGHFVDTNTVDVSEVICPGDQTNPNPGGNPPVTYVKLIE